MNLDKLGKPLLIAGAVIVITLFAWEAISEEAQIIEVKHNIPMSNNAPLYKDLYVNVGGLKKNSLWIVKRKTKIKTAIGNSKEEQDVLVPVGEVKVIDSMANVSIARENSINNPDQNPVIDVQGVLIGDIVEAKK